MWEENSRIEVTDGSFSSYFGKFLSFHGKKVDKQEWIRAYGLKYFFEKIKFIDMVSRKFHGENDFNDKETTYE